MKRIGAIAVAALALLYSCNLWHAAQPFVAPQPVALQARADAARLERTVRELVERFPNRSGANAAQLAAAGEWIAQEVAANGTVAERGAFAVDGNSYFNLVATVGGPRTETIVIGAHYDAHPDTPGADDNASGVAALLELARLFKGQPPACPVRLAFWTLEEPPYFRTPQMGSAVHAAALRSRGEDIRLAMSLEMLGYFRDEPKSQRYPPRFPFEVAYPSEGNFALLVGDTSSGAQTRALKAAFRGGTSLPIESANVPRTTPGADFSDHLNFWREGFPAFMVTDTSFLRNANYHRVSDRPETLDYLRMAEVVNGVAAMAIGVCARDTTP